MPEQQVFDSAEESAQTPSNQLEDWVGEGKKYANIEEAAKANVHAQGMIDALKRQVDELREDLSKSSSVDAILEKLNQTPAPVDTQTQMTSEESKGMSKEELEQMFQERFSKEIPSAFNALQETQKKDSNIQMVDQALKNKFGDKAAAELQRVAKEMEVTPQFLKDMAATSPKAVLKFFESGGGKQQGTERSSVNTDALGGGTPDVSWRELQKLRRENRDKYFSHDIQTMIFKKAAEYQAQGKDFFDT